MQLSIIHLYTINGYVEGKPDLITCEQHGTDQLAYPHSLISAFVVYPMENMITELAI